MKNLWLLTKKNLKLLIRAKGSALIVVFAPLLIILLLSLSFNNSDKYGLNIGVYTTSYTEDVNSFLTKLQEQEFKIVKYTSSINECIEDVKSGVTHTCMSLPESFKIDGNSQKEITFYVDPSKINLVWMIQQTLDTKLNLQSQEISQSIAQDMLSRLSDAKTKVSSGKDQVSSVKEKDNGAVTKLTSTSSDLKKIDISVPTTTYNYNATAEFKTNISALIADGKTHITTAKTALSSSNISSSDKSAVSAAITKANADLTDAAALLEATTAGSYGAVATLVTSLQADVEGAKTKLAAASAQITTSTANMDAIKASLAESVTQLENIHKVLDEVNNNLNAQKVTDAKVVTSPLVTKIETITPTNNNTYLNYMFPGLMILVIMFSSLLLGTTLVMMEKNSPAYTRNFFVPIRKITFVLATYLTNLILILFQVIIILGISWIFLKDIYHVFLPLALILFLAASVFTFLGMVIGYIFSSEETSVLASISLGSMLLFFSGLIIPLESVPAMFREITYFNPFVIAEKLVREVFIFSSPIASIWMELGILLIYALVLFLLILIVDSLMHKHLLHKMFHRHHHAQRKKDKTENKSV